MSLKIVVLAKQVPDTRNVGKDGSEKDHGYIMSSTEVNSNTRKFEEPKYYYFPIPKQQLILNENLSQTKFW